MSEVSSMIAAIDAGSSCEAAKEMWRIKKREANRYTNLAFIVVAAIAISLVVTIILLFIDEARAAAIGTGLSTIVAGGAFVFLWNARGAALKAAQSFIPKIDQYCGTGVAAGLTVEVADAPARLGGMASVDGDSALSRRYVTHRLRCDARLDA